jgi:hypothetical protein
MNAVGDVGDAHELRHLQRAPERRPGRRDDREPVTAARENSSRSPALPRKASSERSTIDGPGTSATSSAPTRVALKLSTSPRRRATRTSPTMVSSTAAGPGAAIVAAGAPPGR